MSQIRKKRISRGEILLLYLSSWTNHRDCSLDITPIFPPPPLSLKRQNNAVDMISIWQIINGRGRHWFTEASGWLAQHVCEIQRQQHNAVRFASRSDTQHVRDRQAVRHSRTGKCLAHIRWLSEKGQDGNLSLIVKLLQEIQEMRKSKWFYTSTSWKSNWWRLLTFDYKDILIFCWALMAFL